MINNWLPSKWDRPTIEFARVVAESQRKKSFLGEEEIGCLLHGVVFKGECSLSSALPTEASDAEHEGTKWS